MPIKSTRFPQKVLLKSLLLMIWVISVLPEAKAQSTYLPLNEDIQDMLDRYEIRSGSINPHYFTGTKPYLRQSVVAFARRLDSAGLFTTAADRFNRQWIHTENREFTNWPADTFRTSRKYVYRSRPDFAHVSADGLDLHINPVLYGLAGRDPDLDAPAYINLRGIEMRALIDDKIGVYTFIGENQARLPAYVQASLDPYRVVPHESLWKDFAGGGVDFLQARGYLTFRASRHIDIQFGHDRNFIGNGYRSMILSDYSAPYLFLKANLRVWKINYNYMISRLNADVLLSQGGSLTKGRYPQKFFAYHQASINLGKKVSVGIFESVIFSPRDSTRRNYFDMGYLNPVIFYRAVEQQFGSPDNVLLGFDGKWLVRKGLMAYGQIVIDEFVLSRVISGDGWWANKVGYQLGMKATDLFGISSLDLQAEWNSARPYTYSQSGKYLEYSHYRQPLAHPLGANFREAVGIIRYQPMPRLQLQFKAIGYRKGKDGAGQNWGGDILKENDINRAADTGNLTGQGIKTDVLLADFTASWMLRHNLFVDVRHLERRVSGGLPQDASGRLTSVALRLNVARRNYDF